MNSKEKVESLKEYLSNQEGQFVNIVYSRPIKVRENSKKLVDGAFFRDFNLTGRIKRLKGNHITIVLNGEKTFSIGLRTLETAYILRNPESQKIRHKLYYNETSKFNYSDSERFRWHKQRNI